MRSYTVTSPVGAHYSAFNRAQSSAGNWHVARRRLSGLGEGGMDTGDIVQRYVIPTAIVVVGTVIGNMAYKKLKL